MDGAEECMCDLQVRKGHEATGQVHECFHQVYVSDTGQVDATCVYDLQADASQRLEQYDHQSKEAAEQEQRGVRGGRSAD